MNNRHGYGIFWIFTSFQRNLATDFTAYD